MVISDYGEAQLIPLEDTKGMWKSVITISGGQFAMICGIWLMLKSLADNWDIMHQV